MMNESMFVNRERELEALEKIYKSNRAEFVLLYGRRRVGKTRLIREFLKGKKAYYFIADVSQDNLSIFSKEIKDRFVRFNAWDDFFEFLYTVSKKERVVVVIDEFQYLYKSNKAWPTILQRWWEKLKNTKILLILCGSIISTIYKIAMGYGSALYGRKTYEIELKPLNFFDASQFFKNYGIEEKIVAYSILGGVPRYLEEFDSRKTIEENLKEKIFNNTSFLYREPMNLFYEEFKNPSAYISIINAIGCKANTFSEISNISGIGKNKLAKYLEILERVKIIKKETPVTESKVRIRNTLYSISDNYLKFWFTFVRPNSTRIELGKSTEVTKEVLSKINEYVGFAFEDISKQFLIKNALFEFTKLGKWWHKDKEIDIVALNEKTKEILFAECKWQNNVNAEKVCKGLAEKSEYVNWHNDKRKETFAIFAKSFSKKIDEFEGKKVYCFDLKDLERVLKKNQK